MLPTFQVTCCTLFTVNTDQITQCHNLDKRCTNPGIRSPNIGGPSKWNLLLVTFLALEFWNGSSIFGKIAQSLYGRLQYESLHHFFLQYCCWQHSHSTNIQSNFKHMQNKVILHIPFRCAEGPIAIMYNCDVTILSNDNERVHIGGGLGDI
jgi:hypothetical protein